MVHKSNMKIVVIVLLLMNMILLPVTLEAFLSVSINTLLRPSFLHDLIPLHHLAYAQNSTLDERISGTGTGIDKGITNITTESDLPNAVSVPASLPKSQQIQMLKIEQQKKPVPLLWLGLHSQSYKKGSRIALIVPVFTGAAYNDAFYIFYRHYAGMRRGENITHNVSLLSSVVTKPKSPHSVDMEASAHAMRYLEKHLTLLMPKNNVSVLTDIDVDWGSIFMDNKNTTNRYDFLILGHQEYVTQQEYTNLKTFVANGGTMILLDGNVLYAQVGYDRITHTVTLIKGHGWTFNGKSAWKSVGERWANETSQWLGSNYLCSACKVTFANNPFGYHHREEQYVTNANDTILLNYNASLLSLNPKIVKNATSAHADTIAAYELNYKKGRVIGLGMYSDDIIDHRDFVVFFDHLLMARQFS
jgi:N,N-dimethylformamidase beta subunit-like protein